MEAMKRKSSCRPKRREGTDGASPHEAGGEGALEQEGGNALPGVPTLRGRVRGKPEFRWNHGQDFVRPEPNGSGRFYCGPAGRFRFAAAARRPWLLILI